MKTTRLSVQLKLIIMITKERRKGLWISHIGLRNFHFHAIRLSVLCSLRDSLNLFEIQIISTYLKTYIYSSNFYLMLLRGRLF